MGYRLPPLNTLRLFEAAGRKLSFKLAAEELGVTPSAVSHGVQTLEDWLGSPLFHRSRKGIGLTAAGATYLPPVAEALKLLASAGDRIPGRLDSSALHISVAPTFGYRLLLPRLHRFRDLHSGIAVSIDTTHQILEFPRDGADVGIRLGHGNWPGLSAERLLSERLVPVCSPSLLARLGDNPALCTAPLIHVNTVSEDWQAWARASGREPVNCQRGLRVDTIQMAIEAAVAGLGIAVGRRPMCDPELEDGSLVRFDPYEVTCQMSYWLTATPESMMRPEIQAFRAWLLDELRFFHADAPNRTGSRAKGAAGLAPA